MSTFDSFSSEAIQFLTDLKANNSRDWFQTNKPVYEDHVKEPGKRFADALSVALGDLTGHRHHSKIFRINRDIRFSKDKTPYNAHLHIAFKPDIDAGQAPMWFFGLSPTGLAMGCGVFQYEKAHLDRFRQAMSGAKGADLIALSRELDASGIRIGDPDLKRVPNGFDKYHRNGDALRRKGFAAWIDKDDPAFATQPALVSRTVDEFRRLLPVFDLLSEL